MDDEQSLGVGLVEATASFDKWWARVESDLAAVTANVAARAAFEAALAQSGNYVADKETSPSRVTFANGRVVAVSSAPPSEVKGDAGTARRGCGVPLWMDSEETCGDGGAGNWCSEACERGDAGTATVEQPAASGAGVEMSTGRRMAQDVWGLIVASDRSLRAIKACADWMSHCLSIGWKRAHLDALQALWWQWHDDDGNLLETPRGTAPGTKKGTP